MSDEPPGLNSPRRKARFHSQYEQEVYRRAPRPSAVDSAASADTTAPAEDIPLDQEGEALVREVSSRRADEAAPGPGGLAEAAPGDEQDDLLPGFRLTKVYEAAPEKTNPLKDWRWLLVTGGLLASGLWGGYTYGRATAPAPANQAIRVKEPPKVVVSALAPEVQAEVDAAFQASKDGQYAAARDQFAALRHKHPEWWSMTIEAARASLYLHDAQGSQRELGTITANEGLPDVNFITALLHLTNKELELAENSFGVAVACDPARPDFFYFWGECLRRDGKPREAVDKFRAALLRNQYENAEGLYQLKLWLSQIQSDQEEASGANAEINAALAAARPPYEALFAAAAREIKVKQYVKASEWITHAQAISEPAVFRVIMQDAAFTEAAAAHPEIAVFYK